jgi:hypothetical protein
MTSDYVALTRDGRTRGLNLSVRDAVKRTDWQSIQFALICRNIYFSGLLYSQFSKNIAINAELSGGTMMRSGAMRCSRKSEI